MNKKEILGNVRELKGRMEQAAGVMTGMPGMEKEGADQRALGKAEAEIARAREKARDAADLAADETEGKTS